MSETPDRLSIPANLKQIAQNIRLTGWISFWVQLVIGVIASLILGFAIVLSRIGANNPQTANNPGTGGGAFLAFLSLLALYFSAYQAFRYTRLARKLQESNPNLRPKKAETIKILRFGLMVSLVGMGLAIIGAEAIAGTLLGKSLFRPESVFNPSFNLRELIQPLDIFVVLGNTHIIAAHFVGTIASLWLLYRLNRQP
ncbi:MAG: DUF3611 family protein [Cyanosarcina radialis HA8281-LM2]|jgi:hypothetical protein|nr:DUF3611 family protein [Cyanosarcina radialis HA8281-LM2]